MPKVVNVNTEMLLDLAERELSQKEMSELAGCSIPTLKKRLADLQEKQGLLLKARDLRNLRLTELQMMVLEAVTPEKIAEAELRDLMLAFKVLSDRENLEIGKPTEIKGLISYLVSIEKEKITLDAVRDVVIAGDVVEEAEKEARELERGRERAFQRVEVLPLEELPNLFERE